MNTSTKQQQKARRHARIRAKISGTADRPRLSVWKGNRGLYLQLIDDQKAETIAGVADYRLKGKTKAERAHAAGKALAELAAKAGIKSVVFDRGGAAYIGRIKAAAEGAREGGLIF